MRMSDPISTNDGERDRNIIRENLMAQLCKRQHNFDMKWRGISGGILRKYGSQVFQALKIGNL